LNTKHKLQGYKDCRKELTVRRKEKHANQRLGKRMGEEGGEGRSEKQKEPKAHSTKLQRVKPSSNGLMVTAIDSN
jgi:hypothetical protein